MSKPSISTSSWFRVCSRSSWPPPRPGAALAAHGVDLVDEDDGGRRRLGLLEQVAHAGTAPTPTNISTKSEPLIEKNGTPASPATARASRVLPVPGGPNSSTPLGILAPMAVNRAGMARKSLISCSSSTASSRPATSAKVILGWSLLRTLARDLPKLMTRLPPPCIWLMMNRKKPDEEQERQDLAEEPSQTRSFWLSTSRSTLAAELVADLVGRLVGDRHLVVTAADQLALDDVVFVVQLGRLDLLVGHGVGSRTG